MNKQLESIKKKIVPVLEEAGVSSASVFGSYARGENKKNSDVDILVKPPKSMSLFGIVGLKEKLEKVLGKSVDLVEYNSIKPSIEKYVLRDKAQVL